MLTKNILEKKYDFEGDNYTTEFSYDNNGNLTKRINKQTGVITHYTFNALNLLIKVERSLLNNSNKTLVVQYEYGPLGRRMTRKTPLQSTAFIYSGNKLMGEVDVQTKKAKFVYLYRSGIDKPFAFIDGESSQTYLYIQDPLGSITGIVDINQKLVQSYTYSSFGIPKIFNKNGIEVSPENAAIKNPLMFTGREYDYETSMYYYRARFYDPSIGRFISPDPIGFAGGDLNLYRYVGNNPVNFVDPSGNLIAIPFATGVVGGIVGLISGASLSNKEGFGVVSDAAKGFGVGFAGGFFAGLGAAPAILGTATLGSGLATTLGGLAIDAGINFVGLGSIASGGNNSGDSCKLKGNK